MGEGLAERVATPHEARPMLVAIHRVVGARGHMTGVAERHVYARQGFNALQMLIGVFPVTEERPRDLHQPHQYGSGRHVRPEGAEHRPPRVGGRVDAILHGGAAGCRERRGSGGLTVPDHGL